MLRRTPVRLFALAIVLLVGAAQPASAVTAAVGTGHISIHACPFDELVVVGTPQEGGVWLFVWQTAPAQDTCGNLTEDVHSGPWSPEAGGCVPGAVAAVWILCFDNPEPIVGPNGTPGWQYDIRLCHPPQIPEPCSVGDLMLYLA
jgi:hypothetical protein